jgi:predicted Zn-ribbon and HTH transcriptional regulator
VTDEEVEQLLYDASKKFWPADNKVSMEDQLHHLKLRLDAVIERLEKIENRLDKSLRRRCNTCKGCCVVLTDDEKAITKCVACRGEGYIQL